MKIKLRKGLTLNIEGAITASSNTRTSMLDVCALIPDDFPGFVPKICVKEGDAVCVGSPLLYDKRNPLVKIVSPLAGTVKAIVRGDRRKILRVEIEKNADSVVSSPGLTKATDKASAFEFLAESGLLSFLRQRPYDIVPSDGESVRDIIVTAMDTAPLAAIGATIPGFFTKVDYTLGAKILGFLTDGKVYFCHDASWTFGTIDGTEDVEVEGRHPAGNAGVQLANIKPINKGEVVWTLDAATLARIGRTAANGAFFPETIVAVTGPEVNNSELCHTIIGAPVAMVLNGNLKENDVHKRIISGNVFTGTSVGMDGYLRFPYRQVTVIAEGDDRNEFMGWASMAPGKMSVSRSFPSHFLSKLFKPDARINGGRRAMIMSGEYDSVIPMDILSEYLIKAILSKNIEEMEKLGIYEVAPEDFAAAEYVCTSKMPLQQIVRDGLDYLRHELE